MEYDILKGSTASRAIDLASLGMSGSLARGFQLRHWAGTGLRKGIGWGIKPRPDSCTGGDIHILGHACLMYYK